jgi:hypothetical protein
MSEGTMKSVTVFPVMCGVLLVGVLVIMLIDGGNFTVHAQQENVSTSIFEPGLAMTLPSLPAVCPPSIGFGETIQCSISALEEVDIYSFTANAGDRIYVRMTTSSGSVKPYVQIFKPDGNSLCGAVNVTNNSTVSTSCTLTVDGTYTVRSSDYNKAGTGDYYLYIQRTNNPSGPVSITFGDTLAGSILSPAQNDTYAFSGNANDVVFVRMSASSFFAHVEVYKSDGTTLCESDGNSKKAEVNCTLPVTGTYAILVGANDGINAGDYHLYIQRLNNPFNSPSISYGQTVASAITAPAEMDTFYFSGDAGDLLVAKMGATSAVYTYLNVFNPDGTKLCGAYNALDGNHVELDCTLTSTGIHTILAGDHDAVDSGEYDVYIQRLKNPGNAVALDFGTMHSDSISTPVDTDTFSFDAVANDRILARISSTSSAFGPRMYLYDPDGTRICSLTVTFIDSCLIPATGKYTILAFDSDHIYTGDYSLYLQRLNQPVNAIPISHGQTLSGTITLPAEMGAYTFSGLTNERVFVRMSLTSGVYRPGIRIYNPDGTARCWVNGDTIAEIPYCTLSSDGTYTILANDYYGDGSGGYNLFLQGLNHPGNAIPIASGQTKTGSIAVIGEVDTYTFAASAGDQIKMKMERAASDTLWPRITVYDPSGFQVCTTWGYAIADLTSCALSSTGTYAVFLDDYLYQTHTGNYTIYFENLTNPGGPLTFTSVGAQDGWVLESAEGGNAGKTIDATAVTLRLGDDATRKQYRSILSFATGAKLPDTAVITKVTLKVKRQGISGGGDPASLFQGFMIDTKKGIFGTASLQAADWQATANKTLGPIKTSVVGGWYTFNLTSARAYINKLSTQNGLTQIRLRFNLDDNNNGIANYLSLYSGNAGAASRPQLIIEYYVP